jgi:hypothetical protein
LQFFVEPPKERKVKAMEESNIALQALLDRIKVKKALLLPLSFSPLLSSPPSFN